MNDRLELSAAAVAAGILLCVAAGAAAVEAAPRTITFADAIALALDRNTTLRQAGNNAAADDIAVRRAAYQFLPRLSASGQGSRPFGTESPDDTRSLSAGISADVTLFDGFGNIASLRGARLAQSAGRDDLQQSRRTVIFTVVANYLALIQQQEQLRVQRENLAAADSLERQIGEYVKAGARTVADLYQQQATVANARLNVVEADRAWRLAQADLMQTLQLPAGEEVVFEIPALRADTSGLAGAPDLRSETQSTATSPALDSLLQRAYVQRADLSAERNRSATADQAVRAAGAAGWPSLSLSAGYGSSYTSAAGGSFSEQFDSGRGGSLALGLSLPLFDRGANRANLELARLQADNSRLALESQRQTVGIEVQRAWLNLRAAGEQKLAAEAQDRASERSMQTSQERYQAGAATFVELAQARASRVQAASALVSARYNLHFQRALLDYYVGEDDPAASLVETPPARGE